VDVYINQNLRQHAVEAAVLLKIKAGVKMLKAVESARKSDAASGVADTQEIPMQDVSLDIWDKKYCLKTKNGEQVDKNIEDSYARVAKALADVEESDEKRADWNEKFLWALRHGAIPAGRITSNAGALEHKPATSTINCTVSGVVEDSMDDVLNKVHEAGLTLKAGCGIGYEFSTLRPKGAFVAGAGAVTSGPLSFMDIYDKMCFTVSSAGGRRGAQMATFDISHPDVTDFIKAKREAGRLRQFNLSCLITKEFMEAVKADADWKLAFPVTEKEAIVDGLDTNNQDQVVWREWPVKDQYLTKEKGVDAGKVACRIYKTIKAQRLWDVIMSSTYDFAEPGFILIDRVNEMNNNWFCENIRATNPCGEQPLPPYGACLLGSVNLTKFVTNPFTPEAEFDWAKYREVVSIFTRMLDNVVEINGLPLEKQREEIARKRRHGMGYLGLGSAMTMMQQKYGDEDSLKFTEEVTRVMAEIGWETGVQLADEKGPAPIMNEKFIVTADMLAKRPEMAADGIKVGNKIAGKVLLGKYSRYMQQFPVGLRDQIADKGIRFTHHSSIAPTGTISLSLANNASNGIEPSFAHHYARNVIREGKKSKEKVDVFSFELLAYRELINSRAMPFGESEEEKLPDYFMDSSTIKAKAHVDIQAAAQKWIDSSISKTINVPTEYDFEDFKSIYLYAYDKGLKGCTTFRFNPEAFQGVLVTEKDLESTTYKFTLDDGTEVEAKGNEDIEYDGEIHSAANLYDALKEGYYGKF
jgi:ribonucleoside-diphosphate reductase alpha chain